MTEERIVQLREQVRVWRMFEIDHDTYLNPGRQVDIVEELLNDIEGIKPFIDPAMA